MPAGFLYAPPVTTSLLTIEFRWTQGTSALHAERPSIGAFLGPVSVARVNRVSPLLILSPGSTANPTSALY